MKQRFKLNGLMMIIMGLLLIFSSNICTCSQGVDFIDCKDQIVDTKDVYSKIDVLASNQTCSILDIYVYKLCKENVRADMVDYDVLTLPQYAYTNEVGKPQLPVIRELLTIPEGASVNVTILECDNSTYENFNIYPVQPQKTDEANESSLKESTSFVIDREFYNQDGFYPSDTIKVGTQGTWRDLAVVNLEFNPTLFNPATGELNVISHIKVVLEYSQSIFTQMQINESRNAIDPEFDKMYKQFVLNYNSIKPEDLKTYLSSDIKNKAKEDSIQNVVGIDNEIDADPVILSIRHEGYSTFSAIKPLLDWHESNGQPYVSWYFYSNAEVTDTMIKDLITARYADYPSLKYVIIWGDIDFMPWHLADSFETSGDKIPGDYWYGLLAGDDLYPELAIGRMSADGTADIQNIVAKTLSYLNAPEGWWSDNVLLVAHKEGAPSQFQGNKETIRTTSYSYPLIYSHLYGASAGSGGDSATNAMVNRAINNRVGIVNYRGHGGTTCWCSAWNAANEDYTTANAASLTNVIKPVIFAICCQTAELDSSSQTLSEAFAKPISIGAVCYFGASRPSWRSTNDLMDRYIFDAIGNLNIRDTGLITDSAKSRALTTDNSVYTKDNINMYLWLGDPALPIRDYPGTKIAMQASNGQYVCAEGSGGGAVVANRNAVGAWEKFTLINRGNDNVALQAANGQYVCAEGSGGGAVVANRNAIGSWETFKLVDKGNGYYALRVANGQYVCAEGSGGGSVVANRNAIGAWEKFRFLDFSRPTNVALQAANGQYFCAEGSGGGSVVANRNAINAWETFNLIDRGNGNVALQAANGQYVCAEGSGGGPVVANRNAIGSWETFRLIFKGNGNVALQAANGQYVCAEGSGGESVVANRNAINAWETFKLIPT